MSATAHRVEWTQERVKVPDDGTVLVVGRPVTVSTVEKPKLFLLHGITAHHRVYTTLVENLGGAFDIYALDFRGRGDSDASPDDKYGYDRHVKDIIAVLDHYRVDKANLAGHSMGAFIALKLASVHPDRVNKLAMIDGGWPVPRGEQAPLPADALATFKRVGDRLLRTFDSLNEYMDFYHPGQNLDEATLPPNVLTSFRYDLKEVEEDKVKKYKPKCQIQGFYQDSASLIQHSVIPEDMNAIKTPILLAYAGAGFAPKEGPLINEKRLTEMKNRLNIQSLVPISQANHYSIVIDEGLAEKLKEFFSS